MKKLILGLILEGIGAQAGPKVTTCMSNIPDALVAVASAQGVATKMFAGIGVSLEWHGYQSCPRGRRETILIRLTVDTPEDYLRASLAYAQPFEGTHVRVFYDRVQRTSASVGVPVSSLLAHVLVHEIAHILKGGDSHSPSGVMMAHWGLEEYYQMAKSPLAFTEGDVVTIHKGLTARASAPAPGQTNLSTKRR